MNIVPRMAACRNIALEIVLIPVWMLSTACMADTAHVQQAGGHMSEQEMSIVSGGCDCDQYRHDEWCGIDSECTDALFGLCVVLVAPCRSNAYSGEWAWNQCHYMGPGGLYEAGSSKDCGWRFDCWCDVGIAGIGTCQKENPTRQTHYHRCGEGC